LIQSHKETVKLESNNTESAKIHVNEFMYNDENENKYDRVTYFCYLFFDFGLRFAMPALEAAVGVFNTGFDFGAAAANDFDMAAATAFDDGAPIKSERTTSIRKRERDVEVLVCDLLNKFTSGAVIADGAVVKRYRHIYSPHFDLASATLEGHRTIFDARASKIDAHSCTDNKKMFA